MSSVRVVALVLILFCIFFFQNTTAIAQQYKYYKTVNDNHSSPSLLVSKPDESIMVQGNTDGSIILRSVKDGSYIKTITSHSRAISYLDFNSTGRLLISASANGEIKVYDFVRDSIINRLNSSQY